MTFAWALLGEHSDPKNLQVSARTIRNIVVRVRDMQYAEVTLRDIPPKTTSNLRGVRFESSSDIQDFIAVQRGEMRASIQ